MKKEEIMALDMDALNERAAAIAEETREASAEQLDELQAEMDAIEKRKEAIKAEADEKRAAMQKVIEGEGKTVEKAEEENRNMDKKEIRKSPEYLNAWVENLKGRASEEQRALLTENANEGGTIAVPTYVEDTIKTAWEDDAIMSRVTKTYFQGNLKVGYEKSAEGAIEHAEGGAAISEENLVLEFVELIPKTFKKMKRYSTEVLDMKGEAFVDYIVDEIEHQIVKTVAGRLINIAFTRALDSTDVLADSSALAGETLTTADIVAAQGKLGAASNPVLITSRSKAAAVKTAALRANYGYDPFDGLEVVYVDDAELPVLIDEETGDGGTAYGVIADLSAWQANFPNGDDVKFVFDEFTEAPADIVRVIGRLYVGVDIVAPKKTVVIMKAGQ